MQQISSVSDCSGLLVFFFCHQRGRKTQRDHFHIVCLCIYLSICLPVCLPLSIKHIFMEEKTVHHKFLGKCFTIEALPCERMIYNVFDLRRFSYCSDRFFSAERNLKFSIKLAWLFKKNFQNTYLCYKHR